MELGSKKAVGLRNRVKLPNSDKAGGQPRGKRQWGWRDPRRRKEKAQSVSKSVPRLRPVSRRKRDRNEGKGSYVSGPLVLQGGSSAGLLRGRALGEGQHALSPTQQLSLPPPLQTFM